MDSIRACPECQEQHASSALSHRERVLQHFSTAPGLGPIDLVLCSKETRGGFGDQKTASFFHQVVGYDVCNTASLAAYFSDLCSNVEEVGFFSGLFTSVQWNITQCVYCAYDAFSRLDVRCHMAIPGGVIAYAVDCKGQRYEMTAAHWKQVSISAFLRYEYYNPSIFRGLPAVVQHQAMGTPDAEETILDSILDLYYDHVPQQVIEMLRPGGQRGSANPEDNDPLLAAVLQHFKRRRVMEGAVEYFTQVASLHAPAVVQLCAALVALGRSEDALQVLRSNALRMPHDTNIICALAAMEAAAGRSQDALALARHALLLAPKSTTALLCMARVQATCGAPALALLAMHLIVPPSDQQVLFKRIFPCGLPPYARITTPSCMPWSADLEILSVLEEEAAVSRTARAVADWRPFVQQLCGIQDGETTPDRQEPLAPELFSESSSLKTSLTYLLPHMSAAKYSIACSCILAMGVENFALTLQALARNATDNGALARGRRRASKRGSLSGRSQPSSVTLDPVPEQDPSIDASQELSAELNQGSMDAPMHRAAGASGTSTGTPMSGVPVGSADLHAAFPGHVQPGEVSDGYDTTSTLDEAVAETPPADLSHVPTDLTPKEHGKRQQGTSDGHPVAEGTGTLVDSGVAALKLCGAGARWQGECRMTSDIHVRRPACASNGVFCCRGRLSEAAGATCEGVKRSGSSNQHLLRMDESSIVLNGESAAAIPADQAPGAVTHLSWEDPSQPPAAHSLRKDAPRFASASASAVTHPDTSTQRHGEAVSGSDSPVGVLRQALQKYEDGSADVTVEGLARLQLRAQEYATCAGPTPSGRMKRRRRLQTMLAAQSCKAADVGKGSTVPPAKGADPGPVASSIVDEGRISATAQRLHQESLLKKSMRHSEGQRIMAALLDSASAPPGAVHHLSHHSADVIAALFGDLDAVAVVHSAAMETPQNGVLYNYSTAAEAVKKNESQFLTFRHRPLHTAVSMRAMIEDASFGDWLIWGASCERVRCLKHAEYAYLRALSLVHPHRCLTGHVSLVRLRSAEADIHTVFDHLTEVLLHLDYRRHQAESHVSSDSTVVVKEGQVPASVVNMLVVVTACWGMTAVQSRLEKGAGQYHPSIEAVIEQAFEWGTDGCDV